MTHWCYFCRANTWHRLVMGYCVDTELVQTHLQAATQHVARRAAEIFLGGHEGALRQVPSLRFDSPLEVIFWVWWHAGISNTNEEEEFNLTAQREVSVGGKDYRVDFLVEPNDPNVAASPVWQPIAVELDGHAFHERTREQVALRDSRDRALLVAGWRVFHFSFAEFTSKPLDCMAEVFMFARQQYYKALQ